jgi:beta-glucosidase
MRNVGQGDPEDRARALLGRMTMEEKVAQLRSIWVNFDNAGSTFVLDPNFSQGPDIRTALKDGIGHITRPFGTGHVPFKEGVKALNALQKSLVEETRLGIPALVHEECLAGVMALEGTLFPDAINLGQTWDPELARRIADSIRTLMRRVGAHQGLGPVADVVRDARWGRVEECIGEDPYLVGVMVTNYVRGLQGEDLRAGIVATPKHFAGHSFGEGGRNHAPVHVGLRELNDVFLLPFEMAVKVGGAQSVMSCYHDVDGVPGSASRFLLTEVLRERWGFSGVVVSDYFAIRFLKTRHAAAADDAEAAARALRAGLDVELPITECTPALPEAVKRGLVTQDEIDLSVQRILAQKYALGLFEKPLVEEGGPYVLKSDVELNRETAERAIVLLKNDGILPLSNPGKIALIGPSADDQLALFGNYHFPVTQRWSPGGGVVPKVAATLRDTLIAEFGAAQVDYARGCRILPEDDRKVYFVEGEPTPDPNRALVDTDASGIAAAAALAEKSDIAIVAVGDMSGLFGSGTVGEGCDTDSLTLPGVQVQLVDAVLATGTPTIVVLFAGRPYDMSEIEKRAAAILFAGFPGAEGAGAIARILSGRVSPSARLTVTFPKSAGVQPMFYNHKILSGGLPRAEYYQTVFPFGHGLGYTRFDYADIAISRREWPIGEPIEIACTVTNVGKITGEEIVQLYVTDPVASIVRPVIELKGFRRVRLAPGESRRVTFDLHSDLLSFTAEDLRRIVEPGDILLKIGASSGDIRLEERVSLVGKLTETRSDRQMFTGSTDRPLKL